MKSQDLDITFSATSATHSYVYPQSSAGQYNGAISDGIGFWMGNDSWSLVKVQGGVLTHLHWGQSLVARLLTWSAPDTSTEPSHVLHVVPPRRLTRGRWGCAESTHQGDDILRRFVCKVCLRSR